MVMLRFLKISVIILAIFIFFNYTIFESYKLLVLNCLLYSFASQICSVLTFRGKKLLFASIVNLLFLISLIVISLASKSVSLPGANIAFLAFVTIFLSLPTLLMSLYCNLFMKANKV